MISGSGSPRLFRERLEIRGAQGLTTDFLSKRFSGLFGLERPGATFPRISGSGIRCFRDSVGGLEAACLISFSKPCRRMPTSSTSSSMALDGTIVRVHQHGTGAKGGTRTQAIGRSRGGLTTKIVALVDALGNLVRFVLLPGQHHESVGVRPLIEGVAFGALLGDKAFDADWLRADLDDRGAVAVIPPKANRVTT